MLNATFTKAADRANCKTTLARTSSGGGKYSYCITRAENVSGTGVWGGIVIELPEVAKLEGHTYKVRYRYKGVTISKGIIYTANAAVDTITTTLAGNIPANTNTKKWLLAESTYTVTNRFQSGKDTYKQLFIGWSTEYSGAGGTGGTRIFIDDIQIYDTAADSSSLLVTEKGIKAVQTEASTSSIFLSARPNATEAPIAQWDGQTLATLNTNRGLTLIVWDEDQIYNPSTSPTTATYDVYGSDTARTNLAAALNNISLDKYWAIVSCQACGTNPALTAAFMSLGATQYAGANLISNSNSVREVIGGEFTQWGDLAPIFDLYGTNFTYNLTLDLKTNIGGNVQVYMQNGSTTKYSFISETVTTTTSYITFKFNNLTAALSTPTDTQAMLAFYTGYGTGRTVSVKNVKVEIIWGNTSPNGAYVAFGYGRKCIKEDRRPVAGNDGWYATIDMKVL